MPQVNNESVAETLDKISELFLALAGAFRDAGGDSGGDGDDAPARGKSAAKPAAKKRVKAAPVEDTGEEIDRDTVREKLKELAGVKGADAMAEALEHVGASKLGDVDDEQLQEVYDKAVELIEAEDEDEPVKEAASAKKAAKKKKKKAGPTLEDVQEAADALNEADAKAYRKVSKAVGDLDELDEDGYQDAIDQFEAAMPE